MWACLMEGMVDAKAQRWEPAGWVPDIREGWCRWDSEGRPRRAGRLRGAWGIRVGGQTIEQWGAREQGRAGSDSGFSAEPVAAGGRSPVWAGGWNSVHQEAVGAVDVESGQGSPVPTAVAPYAKQPQCFPFQGPCLDHG